MSRAGRPPGPSLHLGVLRERRDPMDGIEHHVRDGGHGPLGRRLARVHLLTPTVQGVALSTAGRIMVDHWPSSGTLVRVRSNEVVRVLLDVGLDVLRSPGPSKGLGPCGSWFRRRDRPSSFRQTPERASDAPSRMLLSYHDRAKLVMASWVRPSQGSVGLRGRGLHDALLRHPLVDSC